MILGPHFYASLPQGLEPDALGRPVHLWGSAEPDGRDTIHARGVNVLTSGSKNRFPWRLAYLKYATLRLQTVVYLLSRKWAS